MSTGQSAEQAKAIGDHCSELLALMTRVEQYCESLHSLSTSEREALLGEDLGNLERLTQEKSRLVDEIEKLERHRRVLAGELAAFLGLPTDSTLVSLASSVGEPYSALLLAQRQRVADSVRGLRASNDANIALMRKSIDLVRESMNDLRRQLGREQTYTADGRHTYPTGGISTNLALDCRA